MEGNIFKSVENVNLDTVVAYKSKGESITSLTLMMKSRKDKVNDTELRM